MSMFCYQCQEASKGIACTGLMGVCGVTADTVHLQDLLIHLMKGLSYYNLKANDVGIENQEIDKLVLNNLFATITNANFDVTVFTPRIKKVIEWREKVKKQALEKGVKFDANLPKSYSWIPKTDSEIMEFGESIDGRVDAPNEDVRSLRALALYGIKGIAAYAEHAINLGSISNDINKYCQKVLVKMNDDSMTLQQNIEMVMETGKIGVEVMALLDGAHTGRYGNPEITKVNIGVGTKPGILISGHDLRDLEDLLEQTKGTGVDVYTHSEMLPAHYYPFFKKYENFVGNYGNAWHKQKEEFETFNGPILFTTNCLVPPSKTSKYMDKVFTTGAVGFEGFKHIQEREDGKGKDFSEIIALAKTCKSPTEIEKGEIVGGFAHNQVMLLADKVIEAVKSGAVKKFVVMAGCDGRMKDRNYYTDFAKALPQDSIILTAGCAKYRYNKLELGDIGGIPRVLDAGQCNDSYSLAVIALKLKEVFGLDDINKLPIVYNIAWYEQKAVIVLLALLYLGVKNIHLGPTLPAFLSPNVVKVLVENFGIGGISTVEQDMEMMMA